MTRLDIILLHCRRLGVKVEVSSPGDGHRRFKFYVGSSHVFTAKGAKEAEAWLRGYAWKKST